MNKLTSIRIKQNDGTYSDDILVQVFADNVIWTSDSTISLTNILGQVAYATKGSIQHQLDTFSLDEVEDARVGSDDTQYQNLKARLDSEYENLQDEIAVVTTNLQTQINTRSNTDTTIRNDLNSEITSRINGDDLLSAQIANEVNARESAIINEITERNNAINSAIAVEVNNRTIADTDLSNQIAALKDTIGSPLVAITKSAMIDTNKIYVYTGSESDMVKGKWYYYDGFDWVDGGFYNAAALNTDKTLTILDMAADAKITGDRFYELQGQLNNKYNILDNKIVKMSYISENETIHFYKGGI